MERKPALQSLSPNSLINSRVPPTPPPHDHERGRAMPCRAVRNGCICMLSHLDWINPTVTLTSDHRLLFSAGLLWAIAGASRPGWPIATLLIPP
uniref:Uncharacterized protein n=1 Tax=Oryza nivara TaxID=4536 RepID=A0A0E0FYI0_ORYNI